METSIHISTDKSKLDIHLIHDFLSNQSYWAKGRSVDTVKQSIANSLCFGVYCDEKQAGFARVVTDFTTFAWIMDVFVLPDFRGQGLGKQLVQSILSHEQLHGIARWGLITSDAHGLYNQYGFQPVQKPQNMMEIFNGNIDEEKLQQLKVIRSTAGTKKQASNYQF